MAPAASLYKTGTTTLTTWLVENALRCKVEVDVIEGGGHSHQIPLSQFRTLASAIVSSTDPKIRVPTRIVTLIRHVIRLRKHAADFFSRMARSVNNPAFSKSNSGHQYFIKVLEEVLDILQSSTEGPAEQIDDTSLSGMFAALHVEEPSSEGTAPTRKSKPTKAKEVQYEPETNEFDQAFAIFMFFTEINNIRGYIKSVWSDYRDGKLDVMSAAVTTDNAFHQIRRSCEALSQAPAFLQIKQSGIAQITAWDGSVDHLVATAFLFEYLGGDSQALQDLTCAHASQMLRSFADVLHPQHFPALKKDHFGVYLPQRDRSKMSKEEQEQEDMIVTMNLLPEFVKLSRAHAILPVEDELTTGLRTMMDACDARKLPMFAIFSFQILLDTHNILRQHVERPWDELQATAKKVISTVDDYFRLSRNKHIVNWPAHNDGAFRQIRELAQDWILTDKIAKLPLKLPKDVEKVKPFFLMRNHPVWSGLLMFAMNVRLQEASILLCNAWGTVIYPAHLHNACRQSAGLERIWRDLEYVISTHSAKRIFVGAPPSEPTEYLKRFVLALGGSATNFARNCRPGGRALIVESKKGPRGLKTTTPVRDAFEPRYIGQGAAALTKGNLVAMLAVAMKAERTSPVSRGLQELSNEIAAQQELSSIQLLEVIREGVAAEELHLLFDYIGLHFRGVKLLRNLHTSLHAQLTHFFGSNYLENESELPYIVGYIFEVMYGSNRLAEQTNLPAGDSRLLHTAKDTLDSFLEDEKNSHDSLMKAKAMSATMVHRYHAGTLDFVAAPRQ